MAVDRKQLTTELHRFYDFAGKVVVCVGAGHGQLLDPSVAMAKRIFVDKDSDSLGKLRTDAAANAGAGPVEIVAANFDQV